MIGTFVMKELRINELNIFREKVPECQKQPPSGGKSHLLKRNAFRDNNKDTTQLAFTRLKSTIKSLKKGVKYVQS